MPTLRIHRCEAIGKQRGTGGSHDQPNVGHEHVDTTAIYLHAHLALKERALAKVHAPTASIGRYRPRDALLTLLEAL